MQEALEYVCGDPRWMAAIPFENQQQELRSMKLSGSLRQHSQAQRELYMCNSIIEDPVKLLGKQYILVLCYWALCTSVA